MTIRLATENGVILKPKLQAAATLAELKVQFREACDALLAAPSLARRHRVNEIARTIAITPARTIADVVIKGTAVRLTHFGPDNYFEPLDFDTAIGRLFVSLLHDLDKFGVE